MGKVVDPDRAFNTCTGRRTENGEVKLFSDGVKGELNESQKQQCEIVNVENTEEQYFEDVEEVKEEAETLDIDEQKEAMLDKAVNQCIEKNPDKTLDQQEECVTREYEKLERERGIGEYQ